ncbi:MAG: glycosyltransferase N-terminal domain-containing protein [Bacteroidota bacterium]
MRLFYNITVSFYYLLILIASLFNEKAQLWLRGRKNILKKLKAALENDTSKRVWFHCSSLGEFEQGRPLIEEFRKQYPTYKILLTFFSPSGYEIRKNYAGADYIFYLPADTPANARRFINIVKPQFVFFVKYEYWFNYMNQLRKHEIPLVIVSAVFRPGQYFFKWYGAWALNKLKSIQHFYVQHSDVALLLKKHGIENVTISGDTRFDRVLAVTQDDTAYPKIEAFCKNQKALIVGSSWPADENLILSCLEDLQNYKIIFVPHDLNHVESLLKNAGKNAVLYSDLNEEEDKQIVIVNAIGHLSKLYRYASIAYVGGGFGQGIHNILEPAAYGIPVIFGPNYSKFIEANELLIAGGAFCIQNENDFKNVISLLKNDDLYTKAANVSKSYVQNGAGATQKVLTDVKHFFTEK